MTTCILADCDPESVWGIDAAEGFVVEARRLVDDPRARFETGDATSLPWSTDMFDVAVSGLVLNFVPDHFAMAREMARVTKPGGTVAAYVWDYAGRMEMIRHFWDAAIAVNSADERVDQAERFPICQPEPLRELFREVGLRSDEVIAIDIPTIFRDFDDYWAPFLGKQGSAPTYLDSVSEAVQDRIKETLRSRLSPTPGPIELTARAWAVRGLV